MRSRRRQTVKTRKSPTVVKKKVIVTILFVLLLFFLALCGRFLTKYGPLLYQLAFNHGINLTQNNGSVNLILLGIGGGSHDGPNLTDTVYFVSLNTKTKQTTMVSIPRDLWIPELSGKINTAYAIGEQKQHGDGLVLAKAVVAKVVGQPVDYGVRIDFSGFVKAVDLVGGLDISVQNTFDDYQYPIEGREDATCGHSPAEVQALASDSSELEAFPCRYTHIHFTKGRQHMNGQTALEFVRSRHATGSEGSDFARSRRQALVIAAFKNKIFSAQTVFNPGKIIGLYNTLQASIDTDITQDEFDDFFRLANLMKSGKTVTATIDEGDVNQNRPGLLTNPQPSAVTGYAWVLSPRAGIGNYSEIQSYVGCLLTKSVCTVSPQ